MDWNFFALLKDLDLSVGDIAQAPHTIGYYMLFADNGDFIYIGKARDLHQILTGHFGPNEVNERIKGIAKWAIWQPTQNINEAEDAEGDLYDTWVRITGAPPFANKNKPPKAKLSASEIRQAKFHRQILEKFAKKGACQ